MSELDMTTEALRERLTDLLAEWGAQMSCVLTELEQTRRKLETAEQASMQGENRIAELTDRVRAQDELIETLRAEGESASELRRELNARELELERLTSELESRQDLIQALRRDADEAEQTKRELERKTAELDELRRDRERLEAESRELLQRVRQLEEAADADSTGGSAEIESLKAELEARKSLIKSLRADSDRARALEARLGEKHQLIQQLEETVNRQASTIEELKRKANAWRSKYRSLKQGDMVSTTTTDVAALTDTGIPQLPENLAQDNGIVDQTIAIDMRQALLEARRVARLNDT